MRLGRTPRDRDYNLAFIAIGVVVVAVAIWAVMK